MYKSSLDSYFSFLLIKYNVCNKYVKLRTKYIRITFHAQFSLSLNILACLTISCYIELPRIQPASKLISLLLHVNYSTVLQTSSGLLIRNLFES